LPSHHFIQQYYVIVPPNLGLPVNVIEKHYIVYVAHVEKKGGGKKTKTSPKYSAPSPLY